MYKKIVLLLVFSVFTLAAQKSKDREAIKKMCGCFEVDFKFAETFNYSKNDRYKPSKTKHLRALEYAHLVTDEKNKIVIQHLLVIDMGQDAAYIQKHWRQDWLYQNKDFLDYEGARTWVYVQKTHKQVRKNWTQKVYQVDDSPRYEGTGRWVHLGDKHYWESTANAPLPRREYATRTDYNITLRRNRHEITPTGWVHDQDNDKILNKDGQRILIAQEKGINTYKRVPESRCKDALAYWNKNKNYWADVRLAWDSVFAKHQKISLKKKVNKKKLSSLLFAKEQKPETVPQTSAEIIDDFVVYP